MCGFVHTFNYEQMTSGIVVTMTLCINIIEVHAVCVCVCV